MQKKKRQVDDEWEITIIKNKEGIEDIRAIWVQMQESEPHPVINADVDRYLSVNQAYGNSRVQPYIILIRKDGRPVAMLVGRIKEMPIRLKLGYKTLFSPTLRCLRVAYGGVIGQVTNDVYEMLVRELMSTLTRGETDMVQFNHLRIDSQLYDFCRNMPGFLRKSYFPRIQPHWQTHIPENVESFYESIPSKHKREWRRCERRLAKECEGPVEVFCYCKESEIDQIMKVACDISARSYKHAMNIGITDDALTRALLTQAAREGSLRAYVLYVNNDPCAFEFGVHYRETFFVEYMGYDPALSSFGPGALLWVKVIEDLCTDSAINTLDYGFGDAPYKQRLGTKVWQEASVCIFALRPYPIFVNMLRTSTMGLNASLEYILNKTGLTDWIKRHWRNLLQNKETPKGD